jgi:putative transposase
MVGLCREFGISRTTGYKIFTRYNEIGLEGLTDRSRRPYRHALAPIYCLNFAKS